MTARRRLSGIVPSGFAVATGLTGCSGVQSALDPAAPEAAAIARLWWWMLGGGTVILVVVVTLALIGVLRRSREPADPGRSERRATQLVAAGTIATALILLALLAASVATGRITEGANAPGAEPLRVEVVARQWWWHFRIHGDDSGAIVDTANELHLPAGRRVRLELLTRDVIHSFWVPNLQGKTDLIPGQRNTLYLTPARPGVYRGQCAEFCGLQHAHMGFLVVVEPEEEFERWREAQRQPAREPVTAAERRGRDVFLSGPCVTCHAIRGTPARGRVAPDLTHLASRRTIAAATLPNRRGQLAGWILDSQHVKPGNHMPRTDLAAQDLQDLLDYLGSLR